MTVVEIVKKICHKIYLIGKAHEETIRLEKINERIIMGEKSIVYPEAIVANNNAKGKIQIGKYTHIRGNLQTLGHGGEIIIGDYSYVGPNTSIWSGLKIWIGNRVLIGPNVCIFDTDIHPLDSNDRHRQFVDIITVGQPSWVNLRDKEVIIEDDVWIGTNAIICSGVTIGQGAVVAAGSVVTKDVEPYSVVAGIPARKVSERTRDLRYFFDGTSCRLY